MTIPGFIGAINAIAVVHTGLQPFDKKMPKVKGFVKGQIKVNDLKRLGIVVIVKN